MLNPRRSSEANDVGFIQAGFSDVIANGVRLAGVSDTAWAALILREDAEFTIHLWARQGPAVNLALLFTNIMRTREDYKLLLGFITHSSDSALCFLTG